eukprot:gene4526-4779_t
MRIYEDARRPVQQRSLQQVCNAVVFRVRIGPLHPLQVYLDVLEKDNVGCLYTVPATAMQAESLGGLQGGAAADEVPALAAVVDDPGHVHVGVLDSDDDGVQDIAWGRVPRSWVGSLMVGRWAELDHSKKPDEEDLLSRLPSIADGAAAYTYSQLKKDVDEDEHGWDGGPDEDEDMTDADLDHLKDLIARLVLWKHNTGVTGGSFKQLMEILKAAAPSMVTDECRSVDGRTVNSDVQPIMELMIDELVYLYHFGVDVQDASHQNEVVNIRVMLLDTRFDNPGLYKMLRYEFSMKAPCYMCEQQGMTCACVKVIIPGFARFMPQGSQVRRPLSSDIIGCDELREECCKLNNPEDIEGVTDAKIQQSLTKHGWDHWENDADPPAARRSQDFRQAAKAADAKMLGQAPQEVSSLDNAPSEDDAESGEEELLEGPAVAVTAGGVQEVGGVGAGLRADGEFQLSTVRKNLSSRLRPLILRQLLGTAAEYMEMELGSTATVHEVQHWISMDDTMDAPDILPVFQSVTAAVEHICSHEHSAGATPGVDVHQDITNIGDIMDLDPSQVAEELMARGLLKSISNAWDKVQLSWAAQVDEHRYPVKAQHAVELVPAHLVRTALQDVGAVMMPSMEHLSYSIVRWAGLLMSGVHADDLSHVRAVAGRLDALISAADTSSAQQVAQLQLDIEQVLQQELREARTTRKMLDDVSVGSGEVSSGDTVDGSTSDDEDDSIAQPWLSQQATQQATST